VRTEVGKTSPGWTAHRALDAALRKMKNRKPPTMTAVDLG
jgi:hypothetical protein